MNSSQTVASLPTPVLLLERSRLAENIRRMQQTCDRNRVALWPHAKTHKMVEVAAQQLAAGARGLVCAKIGEAEALLPSGVRHLFLAHSLVDPQQAPRLRKLADSLDTLVVACTSLLQAEALGDVLHAAGLRLPVLMAVDTGLAREGVRSDMEADQLAAWIARHPQMTLHGLYTHEGHAYGVEPAQEEAVLHSAHARLLEMRDRIDAALPLWPGCSVTAARMAALPGVSAVRPGTYVFGDLSLTRGHPVMAWEELALTVLSTVVDRPQSGLALLDAGSKTLSGDRTPDGLSALCLDDPGIQVTRCNEEHGWAQGAAVDSLRIGQRLRLVPAHVCPAVNLADSVMVTQGDEVVDSWRVAARGRVF